MDRAIIYAAGNPDFYPAEYYDPESGSYQGAIPEFLAGFARTYGYELRYLQPGAEDRRAELAENQQVDLISACGAEEHYAHVSGEPVLLFSAEEDGAEAAWGLFLTQVAPGQFQSDLREYAARTTQAQWTGALLEAAGEEPPAQVPAAALAGAGLAVLALLAALAVSLFRLRREKRRKEQREGTDPETGLGTVEALEDAFSRVSRDQSRRLYSLVCIHLDLDQVGRLWGYERAKELLRQGAQALRRAAGPGDILARCGPDLLALKHAPDSGEAVRWAEEVLEQIRAGSDRILRPQDGAAGVYPLGDAFCDLEHARFHAGQCARAACRAGQSSRLCGTDRCGACLERRKLLEDFSQALERDEFQGYLQFFVDADTFQIVGGEALSRWYHPRFGFLSPGRYIPLLEEAGRIEQLDLYGLERACAFLEELGRNQIRDFFLSCNIARRTFCDPGFARRCAETVRRYTFPRKLLILEVTESQRMEPAEAERMRRNIQEIRESGMRVIFDDFGEGFSSFHDLQTYPMDGLKLDKKLVDNMGTENGRIILRALVDVGHRMGLTILAEGVEDEEQIRMLRTMHCDAFQGFRFSVPLPEEEARRRILRGERSLKDRRQSGREEERHEPGVSGPRTDTQSPA